jgi:lysophospholipase L1-like esterase
MKRIAYCVLVFCFLSTIKVHAQQPPFYDEIQAFKKQDSIKQPPQHAILFVGSSSFRKWTDVQSYFPGYTIINRGFGGSGLPDVIHYANDIIFLYHPKEIVIYCGENEFDASDSVTVQMVADRFKTLYSLIRSKMKDVPIVYVSMKPAPSRMQHFQKEIQANEIIRQYINKQAHASFVDVFHLMLNENNYPKSEIFLSDSLHMNAKGYAIWQKAIQPVLIK